MSLSFLRDAVNKRLQAEVDKLGAAAINMRPQAMMNADQYALIQVDKLAEARAFAMASRIVLEEYKKLTETEAKPEESETTSKPTTKEKIYG